MNDRHLPCLLFSPDGKLCDEHDVIRSFRNTDTREILEARFLRSLYGDASDFRIFCAGSAVSEYRIYRLRCFSPDNRFRYAFCEKMEIMGESVTAVYLARNPSAFYPLMSPSSPTISSSLLEIKHSADSRRTSLSAEAFSLMERIPYLAEAIFSGSRSSKYCDIFDFTNHLAAKLSSSDDFSGSLTVRRGAHYDRNGIIEFPTDAYTAVISLICSIESALSSEHTIDIEVSGYSYAADVRLSTVTDRLKESTPLGSLMFLKHTGVREELLHIAATIASISDIDIYVSCDKMTGRLTVTAGIGYEIQSMPDFKHCDPYENIDIILAEISYLRKMDGITVSQAERERESPSRHEHLHLP